MEETVEVDADEMEARQVAAEMMVEKFVGKVLAEFVTELNANQSVATKHYRLISHEVKHPLHHLSCLMPFSPDHGVRTVQPIPP
jgi:hypothetical protein